MSSTEGAPNVAAKLAVLPRPWWMSSVVVVAFLALGVGLRTGALLNDRDLWFDEAMLALNVVERTPAELLQPLDRYQAAPAGFLFLLEACIGVLGTSEVGFRLAPFVCSLLGLAAFAWLSRRLLPRPTALFALGLLAVSPGLVSYASECKQYALDATTTIALLSIAVGLLQGRGGWFRWVGLALAGAAAVWLSHPAAFVLGGIGTALLAEAAWTRNRARFCAAATTAACWLISFALSYVATLTSLVDNHYLRSYWRSHFLPLPPTSAGDFLWLLGHLFAPFTYPGGFDGTEIRAGGIAVVFFIVGIVGLWKTRRTMAIVLIVPGLLALLASGLHRYPFAGRLLLFLVPLMILGVACGGGLVFNALRRKQPLAAFALLGVLIGAPCLETVERIGRPIHLEQITPMLAEIRRQFEPGDKLYVYYGAAPAFAFYTREHPFPAEAIVRGIEARANPAAYRAQLAEMRGSPRVWLLFSHLQESEEAVIRTHAEGLGRSMFVAQAPGAAVHLFDFDDQAEQADQP